jgi:exopolysaccharide biosynthesis polyprenyl glycosylphosphotransferase
MLYHNVMVTAHYRRVIDTTLVGAAATGVWLAGAHVDAWDTNLTRRGALVFVLTSTVAFAWLGARFHVYQARRTEHLRRELHALLEGLLYALGLSCLTTEIATAGLPGRMYLWTLILGVVSLLAVHGAMRVVIRRLRRAGREFRIWLIIGRNERSASIATGILENPHFGVRIAEIIDIGSEPRGGADVARFGRPPLSAVRQRSVSRIDAVRGILETHIIDEVVVTLPLRTFYDEIQQVLDLCGEAGISVKFSTEVFDQTATRTQLQYVGNIPMVTHFTGPAEGWQLMVKRVLDVLVAGTALVVMSPLFAAIAVAIAIESRGGVLFRQTRTGLHGRQFTMLKFRTMVDNAPQMQDGLAAQNSADGVVFKIKNDPRITRVGRWLRKYHLDECPQLWNVLVGDMSLVGPRALPPREAIGSEWWQRRRLSMPPGLTCHWQVHGEDRHEMPFRRWMELDLAYIDGWSVWLDLQLILRTLWMLPRGSGW